MSAPTPIRPNSFLGVRQTEPEDAAIVGNPISKDLENDYGSRAIQEQWRKASCEIITDIARKQFTRPWQTLFETLAETRHQLARQLGHRAKNSHLYEHNDFGLLRYQVGTMQTRMECISSKGPWSHSYPECRKLALEYFRQNLVEEVEVSIHSLNILTVYLEEGREDDQATLVETFGQGLLQFLASMRTTDSRTLKLKSLEYLENHPEIELPIKILYPTGHFVQVVMTGRSSPFFPEILSLGDCRSYRQQIDAAYNALLQPEKSLGDFLHKAARYSYYMARLLPCHRGTGSIIDWMIRGIALRKGYVLGNYNHEHLGWDLKALLTPHKKLEEYCHWYLENAFVRQ